MSTDYKTYKAKVEAHLDQVLTTTNSHFNKLYEAMNYSLQAGGKRIRPVLMQLAYESVGGKEDISKFLCAIEMIHTYSLIHDDLPAMDDDDYRRGKLTCHKKFDEATAILAGDGLLTEAFGLMLTDALASEDMSKVYAAHVLAKASGAEGMIGGQILDIESENKAIDKETLDCIHLNKTGALIAAATKMGGILGQGSPMEIAALEAYGKYIGKVFQIVDDILDETSTIEELGKPIQSDIKNQKTTYLSFYSVEACYEIAQELTQKAIKSLEHINGDTALLKELAVELITRRN